MKEVLLAGLEEKDAKIEKLVDRVASAEAIVEHTMRGLNTIAQMNHSVFIFKGRKFAKTIFDGCNDFLNGKSEGIENAKSTDTEAKNLEAVAGGSCSDSCKCKVRGKAGKQD